MIYLFSFTLMMLLLIIFIIFAPLFFGFLSDAAVECRFRFALIFADDYYAISFAILMLSSISSFSLPLRFSSLMLSIRLPCC